MSIQESEAEAAAATIRAAEEGRVDGKYRCSWCGMRSNDETEARECCKELSLAPVLRVAETRYDRRS